MGAVKAVSDVLTFKGRPQRAWRLRAGSIASGVVGVASAQTGGSVRHRDKSVTVKGEGQSELDGINASGAYAGEGYNRTDTGIKLCYELGQVDVLQASFKGPLHQAGVLRGHGGIDNAGEVVGFYFDAAGRSHGFERLPDGRIAETGRHDDALKQLEGATPGADSILRPRGRASRS